MEEMSNEVKNVFRKVAAESLVEFCEKIDVKVSDAKTILDPKTYEPYRHMTLDIRWNLDPVIDINDFKPAKEHIYMNLLMNAIQSEITNSLGKAKQQYQETAEDTLLV